MLINKWFDTISIGIEIIHSLWTQLLIVISMSKLIMWNLIRNCKVWTNRNKSWVWKTDDNSDKIYDFHDNNSILINENRCDNLNVIKIFLEENFSLEFYTCCYWALWDHLNLILEEQKLTRIYQPPKSRYFYIRYILFWKIVWKVLKGIEIVRKIVF